MGEVVNSFICLRSKQLGREIDPNLHVRERLFQVEAELNRLMDIYAPEVALRYLIKNGRPQLSDEEFTALQKRVREVMAEEKRLKEVLNNTCGEGMV
ncbi:hypothetical protein SAMN00808754_1461 [Thermanaeromonas toyohensis ToBE]|uniref:Uncharacterized protein n=1 Tax=Thermanaeromonas toyohensis ToBE TaxID=698762 RepID=A0A1W1VSK0_9FIRM|nr:hypothetical protein [Thermanaeromonas toyohensis]SMB96352.1 hypothetical protein SAMN00808754_1461 [Thermanaeromonas toyohensis ToBE]